MARNTDRIMLNVDQIIESLLDNGCGERIITALEIISERISVRKQEY